MSGNTISDKKRSDNPREGDGVVSLMFEDNLKNPLYNHWKKTKLPYDSTIFNVLYLSLLVLLHLVATGILITLLSSGSNWDSTLEQIFFGDLETLSACIPDENGKLQETSRIICNINSNLQCGLCLAGTISSLIFVTVNLTTYLRPLKKTYYTQSIDLRHLSESWRQKSIFFGLCSFGLSLCLFFLILFIGLHLISLVTTIKSSGKYEELHTLLTNYYGNYGFTLFNILCWVWLIYFVLLLLDVWLIVGPFIGTINHPHISMETRK